MTFFLKSARLKFRCWTEEDLPLATALWTDENVMRYMGGPSTPEAILKRLHIEMERQLAYGVQYWPLFHRTTDEFVGCSGLRPFHDESGVFEMGVHIVPRFWSERLGEEAARTVMQYAFEELQVRALTAAHGPGNVNSQSLIERLGFWFTHEEPWGLSATLHPFYRLNASA